MTVSQLNFSVDTRVYDRLAKMATAAGIATGAYAKMLFEAAYAARCAETGDLDLDTADSRVALLFGSGFDADSIRASTGLSEAFVEKALTAWRSEMRRGPASIRARATS